jgi:outer membrane assembly lipoprotein YfiO
MRSHLHRIVLCGMLLGVGAAEAPAAEYVWKDGKWVPAAKPAEGTVEGELAIIRAQIARHDRKKALAAVDRFLATYRDDPACEEAMLLAGQAELDAGRYHQAYERFEEMLDRYPNGRFLERALSREMDVANAFLAGKKRIVGKVFRLPARDEGLDILRRIAEHAPGSLVAESAMLRIGEYHYERGEYAESAEAYDEFLQLFPRSGRVPHAMLQGARAMFASFKGVAYDETPLIEAEQRYKVILDQYPAAGRKAKAQQVLGQIAELRAQRAFETAKFYERTQRPQAAKFYYQQVVDQYPASAWAGEARAALGGRAARRAPRPEPRGAPKAGEEPAPKVEPPKPKATTRPAPRPKPKPAPKARPKPGPSTRPTTAPRPVDLEKLLKPSRKGGKK